MTALYGIRNCDTVRRARRWLDAAGIAYTFHDLKAEGIAADRLSDWAGAGGWQRLLNRQGTTFRKLPEDARADLDEARALALLEAHPSAIKRPVVEHAGGVEIGFNAERYQAIFGG